MAFGSNDFPLGPQRVIQQRIKSYGNEIYPPERMEEAYERSGLAKLPAVEKDYHSSVARVKNGMKVGKPNKHALEYDDIDKFRPKYAQKFSLRHEDEQRARRERQGGNDEWLKRRKQRFPYGLQKEGAIRRPESDVLRPATGMSGVGFFGRRGELGDIEQKFQEDSDMVGRPQRTRRF